MASSKGKGGASDAATFTTARLRVSIAKELRVNAVRTNRTVTEIIEEAVRQYCAKQGIFLPDDEQEPASRIA